MTSGVRQCSLLCYWAGSLVTPRRCEPEPRVTQRWPLSVRGHLLPHREGLCAQRPGGQKTGKRDRCPVPARPIPSWLSPRLSEVLKSCTQIWKVCERSCGLRVSALMSLCYFLEFLVFSGWRKNVGILFLPAPTVQNMSVRSRWNMELLEAIFTNLYTQTQITEPIKKSSFQFEMQMDSLRNQWGDGGWVLLASSFFFPQ